ncbi:phosphoribosyltransferase domain-containing protein [Bacillus sp. BRMEA1]|uniref:phosphoribosyltransferase family protein n=1 Tax=Neobacillus endophyticus TaxID=2738405 RepID=UPI0015658DA2|nr:phosphoribosyltransferase family protein [Neobacillus endophyticus]NRD80491.1 phosphoribosyltransferase domain-containing protein [Neobacillus endophyticus]
MKNSPISTLSKKEYSFPLLDAVKAEIEISQNPYGIPVKDLFVMAARINKKRSFLFVSKVLGKHLPIEPNKGLAAAGLLAARYLESYKGVECTAKEGLLKSFYYGDSIGNKPFIPNQIQPIIIGFAETATALGHAFFDCFQAADYFHTTREKLVDIQPEITFEEEHSHATSHRLYISRELLQSNREIILVDDELTTGKTALNVIRAIQSRFPRKRYTVISILDWRSKDHITLFARLENELGIKINVVSLISGTVTIKKLRNITECYLVDTSLETTKIKIDRIQLSSFFTNSSLYSVNVQTKAAFIKETGRFGINSAELDNIHKNISQAALLLKGKRQGNKTLCLGTGEFMYLPMRIAAEMGDGVSYQSTTRSPIYIDNRDSYGARYGFQFRNPEDTTVSQFVYNIPPQYYDEIFLFFERETDLGNFQILLKELEKLQVQSAKLVFFSR